MSEEPTPPVPHKRRVRYRGTHPRRYAEKYKEHDPARYGEAVAKVIASGKTPAGMHVPIMVQEIMIVLHPHNGERAVDCTLGYGGHARELLQAVQPDGALLGLDQDPIEIERTTARLKALGFNNDCLHVRRMNFAGLPKALADLGWEDGVDVILADLGVSSMQIDNPERGFSFKHDGPLDMRMNPARGLSASELLARHSAEKLASILTENADEPKATLLAEALAGRPFERTLPFADAIRRALPRTTTQEDAEATVRRVFQALRIEVNEEFSALDSWLRAIPQALRNGGRAAVLTFHSGEDRRIKKAFQAGFLQGLYAEISREVTRATPEEMRTNPRATSAKLRWAIKA